MNVNIVNINTISDDEKGSLSFIESEHDINFIIKRIFYISGVNKGVMRGGHAHKSVKQFLFCPYGSILILCDDGKNRLEFHLDNPSIGLFVDKFVWLDLKWIKKNSILCVAASDYYDESDYIRDYDEFKRYIL